MFELTFVARVHAGPDAAVDSLAFQREELYARIAALEGLEREYGLAVGAVAFSLVKHPAGYVVRASAWTPGDPEDEPGAPEVLHGEGGRLVPVVEQNVPAGVELARLPVAPSVVASGLDRHAVIFAPTHLPDGGLAVCLVSHADILSDTANVKITDSDGNAALVRVSIGPRFKVDIDRPVYTHVLHVLKRSEWAGRLEVEVSGLWDERAPVVGASKPLKLIRPASRLMARFRLCE